MSRFSLVVRSAVLVLVVAQAAVAQTPRVLPEGQFPKDARLKAARTLYDAYHPWTPPATLPEWEHQKQRLREQLLVSLGLWPMPVMAKPVPVIHGKIERDGYTIEKVSFESFPGHVVTGNLYRPIAPAEGKRAGVLFAHGHWKDGRMYDAGDAAEREIAGKGEQFQAGAKYPLQALPVGLARLGAVVFQYDMVGYADSLVIPHREGFGDIRTTLWQQNLMGLQTLNSLQSLEFLLNLPDVDPKRIGMTGASGGGTQTFILCALDSRPAACFPAVMVGTAMQGGCVCENANYLRIGTNNVAFAAMAAPMPQAQSGADDWTIDIETKGLPELKKIYGLYGAEDKIAAKCFPQFKHNYNQIARQMMYAWFNTHLALGATGDLVEKDFSPVPPSELTVFDAAHPAPSGLTLEQFKQKWEDVSRAQFAELVPKQSSEVVKAREKLLPAVRVMLDELPPSGGIVPVTPIAESDGADYRHFRVSVSRKEAREQIPMVTLAPFSFAGEVVLWVDPRGTSALFAGEQPAPFVKTLFDKGVAVAAIDPFMTGEYLPSPAFNYEPQVSDGFPGYTFGYNKPLISQRVRDVLTAIRALREHPRVTNVHLAGTGAGGVWALLARASAGDAVGKTVVDVNGFGFSSVTKATHPDMLPGVLKYGGLGGMVLAGGAGPLEISGANGAAAAELQVAVETAKAAGLPWRIEAGGSNAGQMAAKLVKP
jgi:hypothetical protein